MHTLTVMKQAPTLFDTLYRASFSKQKVSGWVSNQLMRALLVSARRFMLDDAMSAFMTELSFAGFVNKLAPSEASISPRILRHRTVLAENLRVSARLPHQVMWVEYNLQAALHRINEIYARYSNADRASETLAPKREGWLLRRYKEDESVHLMIFAGDDRPDKYGFTEWTFPVSFCWSTDDSPAPWPSILTVDEGARSDAEIALGIFGYHSPAITVCASELLEPWSRYTKETTVQSLLSEWVGTVRRVWALLAAINDIPVTRTQVRQTKGFVARGSYRRFLDHTIITLHVPQKRQTTLARQLIALARRRAHQVRGHWREDWRNPGNRTCVHQWQTDQTCALCRAHRLWIHEHQRGDASLGFVTHDYKVTHENEVTP